MKLDVPGWMGESDLEWLRDRAAEVPKGQKVVELGCWLGRSTIAICSGHPYPEDVTVVDTFEGSKGEEPFFDFQQYPDPLLTFIKNLKSYVGLVPEILIEDSVEAAKYFPPKSVSMLFIDADHTKVANDIRAWHDKMAPSGLVCGHDWQREDVKAGVITCLGQPQVANSIWYYYYD